MSLVSPFLKRVVYPGLSMTGRMHRRRRMPVVVTYHGIQPERYKSIDAALDGGLVTASQFTAQLSLLKRKYHVISPQEFRLWYQNKLELPRASVLLTCDDGLQNVLTAMLPILEDAGFPCLFFITGKSLQPNQSMLWYEQLYLMLLASNLSEAYVEEKTTSLTAKPKSKRELWSDLVRNLSRHDADERDRRMRLLAGRLGLREDWCGRYEQDTALRNRFFMLDQAGAQQLSRAVNVTLGAHTLSHPVLSQSSDDVAWNEIRECRRTMEQTLDREIWTFAYPFGDVASVTDRERSLAERAGFECAFLNLEGELSKQTPRFALPRVHVTAEMDLAEFEAHVSGFYFALRRMAGRSQR